MAKDKERSINPAAQQRKLEKQKALKKGKAAVQAQRTERFANRNPNHLQRQIEDLKGLQESSGGKLSARDKKNLEDLERDLARVKKARELLGKDQQGNDFRSREGDSRPARQARDTPDAGRGGSTQSGAKRWRDGSVKRKLENGSSSGSETDESVRRIPMPKDTPPPIPYVSRRRPDNARGNPNLQPLGSESRIPEDYRPDTTLPAKPLAPAIQTVYEAKPAVRDLRKEAVSRFIPSVVRKKIQDVKGSGRLLEAEEVDMLEKAGYKASAEKGGANTVTEAIAGGGCPSISVSTIEDRSAANLEEEERRFRAEMEMEAENEAISDDKAGGKTVYLEEIADEDG
ncbi:hypothetical protein MMC25_005192 [Agyrium rufum]|nr:hypothetical protein [Agyrium rufum]